MDRGLCEQSFVCTASDRLIRLRSRDVSSTVSKTLQTSVIAFSVYFWSEAPLLIPRPQELCTAWAWRLHWQVENKKNLKRINQLIKDIERHPFEGIGKPEPLKGNLTGLWSRRIDEEHRIVYLVEGDNILIFACRGHYDS